ncbi:hypothetical protein [Micromonospora zhanjiangensis]|uniref:Flavin reductase n=1 Tax=Micromonospora zhanjiangensis TaxID=1522057 RepID=A0ABV8KJC1_9ACTN
MQIGSRWPVNGIQPYKIPVLALDRLDRKTPADARQARRHVPLRPIWICRACAAPWPCAMARLLLRAGYLHDRVGLAVHLCGLLHEAARDLYRLNPHDAPPPRALFERFVGWTTYQDPTAR